MLDKLKSDIDLITRHILVLSVVAKHQPIGIIKLSELLSLPHHRIRYSLRVLENLGYICASPTGACVTAQAEELFLNLNKNLDDIIKMVSCMKIEE